jgi:hypothetical protein
MTHLMRHALVNWVRTIFVFALLAISGCGCRPQPALPQATSDGSEPRPAGISNRKIPQSAKKPIPFVITVDIDDTLRDLDFHPVERQDIVHFLRTSDPQGRIVIELLSGPRFSVAEAVTHCLRARRFVLDAMQGEEKSIRDRVEVNVKWDGESSR